MTFGIEIATRKQKISFNLKTAARWIAHCGSHLKQETKKHENWENSQSFKRMDVILFKVYILDPVITLASYGKAQVTFLRGILCCFWTVKTSGLYFDLVQYFDIVIDKSMSSDNSSCMQEVCCWWGKSMSSENISQMQEVCQLIGESTGSNKSY